MGASATGGAFVEVVGAEKSYGTGEAQVQVLRKLSLQVEQGTICVILGSVALSCNLPGDYRLLPGGSRHAHARGQTQQARGCPLAQRIEGTCGAQSHFIGGFVVFYSHELQAYLKGNSRECRTC